MKKILILAFLFTITWKLSCGIALNCTYGMSISYAIVGSVYQCNAGILWDVENREVITVIYGAHQNDYTHEHVQALSIVSQGLEYFPVNIAEFFRNIKLLYFVHNAISYVSNQHLIPLPNLVYLEVYNSTITSLSSNLLSGLDSIQIVSFRYNKLIHVGHDFILPNTGRIYFSSNPCINIDATTPDDITALRFRFLVDCPPTISQIEDTLEGRPNWITNIDGQVQSIVNRTDVIEQSHSEMDDEVKRLTNTVVDLDNRNLQLAIEVTELRQSNGELNNEMTTLTNEVTELTDEVTYLQQSNSQLTTEVTDLQQSNLQLTNEVTGLQESNVDLTNRNSQLQTRIAIVDARAGYLELRVAALEAIIESKLGVRIDEAIIVSIR